MLENKIKIDNLSRSFKDGQLIDFFSQCWLIPPSSGEKLDEDTILSFAEQISKMIEALGDNHMIPQTVEELITAIRENRTMIFTDPDLKRVLAFVKIYPWKNKDNETIALELGSLIVARAFQRHHLGIFLVKQFSQQIKDKYPKTPIVSVVTSDNLPSLNLFRNLGWREETALDPNNYYIQGVNILEGWRIPSSIFYYNNQ